MYIVSLPFTMFPINVNKKLSYRRGTARRAVSVKTMLNVAQMFVELHVISPALGEWPSRSSKVTGNGMAKNEESAWDNHVFACNYHLVIDRISFINKAINCMHQTWPTQDTRHPASDMHTVGVHHVCHNLGRHVSYGSFFRLTLKVSGHYQWDILLHYLNKC